jgi:formylglycine-generating enzyme required for sulfatase activity
VEVTLKTRPGTVDFTTTPVGARAIVSGGALRDSVFKNESTKAESVTPFRGTLPPGDYTVRFELSGYRPATKAVTVTANRPSELSAALEKLRGPDSGQALTIPDLELVLQPIAAGSFAMGSETGDRDEKPVTRVMLTKPFWLGRTEVTQREWVAVMGNNPSHFKGDNLPVEQVSSEDALAFCRKLTERERAAGRLPEGYVYTLPTEAQWEYACRAETTADDAGNLADLAWYDRNSGRTTHAVGTKRANAWGLSDMHGNVWEWCLDWYVNRLPGGQATDWTGPASGSYRVYRGGGWADPDRYCRSSLRHLGGPGIRSPYLGFRVALSWVRAFGP